MTKMDPTDGSWGYPALPAWVKDFRPYQEDAIVDILEAYERGAKVVFLDAPTGSGKTLIAEATRRKLATDALYTCTTKTLQDQFISDYDYAALLKGRDNYPTMYAPFPDVTAGDCLGSDCDWCDDTFSCAYVQAKTIAQNNPLAVLNTAYALTVWNYANSFKGRGLVILDECDLLEQSLMGFVEVRLTKYRLDRYNLPLPAHNPRRRIDADIEWVDSVAPTLRRFLARIPDDTRDVRQVRDRNWLSGMLQKLYVLRQGLVDSNDDDAAKWVYDNEQKKHVVFKPVEVSRFGDGYLWQHGQRFLLMSASIVSPREMAMSLGLDDGEWETVRVESTFPPENRPIHILYSGRMTSKMYDESLPKLVDDVAMVLDNHPNERILVHTVSYKLANDIYNGLASMNGEHQSRLLIYQNSGQREEVLSQMKETPGSVVLAPSFDRGVDLPGDLCTVQIIAKVPYPYLGDKQVSARLHMGEPGQLWFNAQTARSLIQMTGRGVRHEEDTCTTYILDRQFHDFYRRNKRMFPEWWKEALDLSGRVRSRLNTSYNERWTEPTRS